LVNSYAHFVQEDDYPWGFPPQDLDRRVAAIKEMWDKGPSLELIAPAESPKSSYEPGMPARHDSSAALIESPTWCGPATKRSYRPPTEDERPRQVPDVAPVSSIM
jgi:hypothetical protein